MQTIEERLAILEEQVRALRRDVREGHEEIVAKIDGGHDVPYERSVRGRLHVLENESYASRAASRALTEAQAQRRASQHELAQAERISRAQAWRYVGAAIAIAAIVAPYVALALGVHVG